MPRTFIRHTRQRSDLRKKKVYRNPEWNDPFWWIQGSSIEKMVMAEFVRRGIYFEHTPQTNPVFPLGTILDGTDIHTWEADFLIPQHKIWIEVQGSYFHSKPGQIENDSIRFAMIEVAGWRPMFWWEFDIRNRLMELFDAVPEFYMAQLAIETAVAKQYGTTTNLPFFEGGFDASGNPIDHLAGLRKALANRTRPPQFLLKRRFKRRPK